MEKEKCLQPKTTNEILGKPCFSKQIRFNSEEETYVVEPSLNNLQLKLGFFIATEIQERYGFSRALGKSYEFEIPKGLQVLLAPLADFGFTLRINDYLFDVWIDVCNGIRVVYSTQYNEAMDVFGEILNFADIYDHLEENNLEEIGELTW